MEQNRKEMMHEAEIHFNPARSKMGEQLAHQINLGKVIDDHLNRDITVDWKKEMLEKNLITIDLVPLIILGVSKPLFIDWITADPKPRDFTPPVFKLFEGNSNLIEHIFQF